MLVFGSYVAGPAPAGCPHGKTVDRVEPFLIGQAEIIRDRLAKMTAIGEWLAGNVRHASIDGFHLAARTAFASSTFQFAVEFRFQDAINAFSLRSSRSITAKDLAERSPLGPAEIKIMVSAVNILRDEISDHRTNDYI